MVLDYSRGWSTHLLDTLWTYFNLVKTATGFSPFSIVYGTKAVTPAELVILTTRMMQGQELEVYADTYTKARVADL